MDSEMVKKAFVNARRLGETVKTCPLCGLTEDRWAVEDCNPNWDILDRELPPNESGGLIVGIKLKD